MKITIINTFERNGGAGIAAFRLKDALKAEGEDVVMLVRDKSSNLLDVHTINTSKLKVILNKLRFIWERFLIYISNKHHKEEVFLTSVANTGTDISKHPDILSADIIHLHWFNQGFLSLKDIKSLKNLGKPIVWTTHDMWPYTGICHYAGNCDRYETHCRRCPFLFNSNKRKDLAYYSFKKKKDLYENVKITFVACSNWLKSIGEISILTRKQNVINIPNPIQTEKFKSMDKIEARKKCGLPTNKKLILFGSVKISEKRKGANYLIDACNLLKENYPETITNFGVVAFGKATDLLKKKLPFPIYTMDYIESEEELIRIYNAVDIYVTPSLEDNLPNTVMEAMACGIPCIGFNTGGIPEMIDHLKNGYIAKYRFADDLANGIYSILTDESHYAEMSSAARTKVEQNYTYPLIAQKYIQLYKKLMKQ